MDQDGSNGWGCVETIGPNKGKPTAFFGSATLNEIAEGKTITAMPEPANTVLVSEKTQKQKVSQSAPAWQGYASDGSSCPRGTGGPTTHNNFSDGGNFGFADGHAKFSKKSAMKYSQFGWTGVCRFLGSGATPPNVTNVDATLTPLLDKSPKKGDGSWTYRNWDVLCDGSAF